MNHMVIMMFAFIQAPTWLIDYSLLQKYVTIAKLEVDLIFVISRIVSAFTQTLWFIPKDDKEQSECKRLIRLKCIKRIPICQRLSNGYQMLDLSVMFFIGVVKSCWSCKIAPDKHVCTSTFGLYPILSYESFQYLAILISFRPIYFLSKFCRLTFSGL